MKPETAAELFSIALKNDDIAAMSLACQHKPWARGASLPNPLAPIAQKIQVARRDRKLRVADTRAQLRPFLQLMARHGYSPTGPALVGLAEIDPASMVAFAQVANDFSEEHPAHGLILHRMVSSRKMKGAWVKLLVAEGFGVNHQDPKGNTPAHHWVEAMLRIARKNPNAKDVGLEIAQSLLEHGADFALPNHAGLRPADGVVELSRIVGAFEQRQTLVEIVAQLMQATTQVATAASTPSPRRL